VPNAQPGEMGKCQQGQNAQPGLSESWRWRDHVLHPVSASWRTSHASEAAAPAAANGLQAQQARRPRWQSSDLPPAEA